MARPAKGPTKLERVKELPGLATASKRVDVGGKVEPAYNVAIWPYHSTRELDILEFPGAAVVEFFDAMKEAFDFVSQDLFQDVQHNFWMEGNWGVLKVAPGKGFEHYPYLAHGVHNLSINGAKYDWRHLSSGSGEFCGFVKKPHPFEGRNWLHADALWVSHHPAHPPVAADTGILLDFAHSVSAIANEPPVTVYPEGWWWDEDRGEWRDPP